VTGTLFGGTMRRGQLVVVQPSGKPARIRRIQSHGRDVETSGPGTRTALNLADVDAVEGVHRGDVVTLAGLGGPSEILDVLLEASPRATRSIKNDVRVRVHHGSGNVAARVALGSGKELAPGMRAVAELRLEAPAFVFAGDHFTVRDWSEQHTLAGAVVLDPDATRKAFRSPERLSWLARAASAIDDPARFLAAYIAHRGAVRRSQLLLKSRFSDEDLVLAVDRLVREGELVSAGDVIADAAAWQAAGLKAATVVDAAHRAHPEQRGVSLSDLRHALQEELPLDELFDPLMASLCQREFVREGAFVRRASHRAELPAPLQAAGAKLGQALAVKPLDPPSRKELAPDATSQRALRFLIETGEVVEINTELVMAASAVSQATALIQAFIRGHGPATVSELRQALGSSRRVIVPLLEYLDRTFVTLRHGDKRTLRGSRSV
jgi:selenocysteine-specific elongation factor